ncbi:Redoxin [Trametopsis cervina]|nr:Redoxin [Trametopsis cervina]
MASILSSVTNAAHSAAANLLSAAQVQPGATIPTSVTVKEEAPDKTFTFAGLTGRNVFVGVPGAFTGTCSRQIPGYIKAYGQFKEKGVENIYVVAVNDTFVMQAWKDNLAPGGTPIRFIADDTGAFTGAIGLLFDASARLGSPRSKRYVLITEGETIQTVIVENATGELTVTAADKVLPLL